jgi:hypothetical protein
MLEIKKGCLIGHPFFCGFDIAMTRSATKTTADSEESAAIMTYSSRKTAKWDLVQCFFLVRLDRAIGSGVSHTSQHETRFDLVVIQEGLIGLVDRSSSDFTRASRASARPAGVREVDALLFSGIQNVFVFSHFDRGVQAFSSAD